MALVLQTGTLTTDQRQSYMKDIDRRMSVYKLMPIQDFALTAFMDKLGSTPTSSRTYKWTNQDFNALEETPIDVYTDSGLASAYSAAGAAGSTAYIKMTAAAAQNFDVKDIVRVTRFNAGGYTEGELNCTVVQRMVRGNTDSFIGVTLNAADDSTTPVLAGGTLRINIVTTASGEIDQFGDSRFEEPFEYTNNIQHMMASAAISDLEAAERMANYYGSNPEEELKLIALYRLNQKREGMRLFGDYSSTGTLRSRGLISAIETYASSNVIDWRSDTTFSTGAETWLQGFLPFARRLSEYGSRYSKMGSTKTMFTSSYVVNEICEAVLDSGEYIIEDTMSEYGTLPIKKLRGLNQDWELVQHPMFSVKDAYRYNAVLTEIPLLTTRVMNGLDLRFIPWKEREQRSGEEFTSAKKCGWEIYEGFQWDNIGAHFYLKNLTFDQANA